MASLVSYTPAERKRVFDLKYKLNNNVHFVIDNSHTGNMPVVEVATDGFNVICTDYQNFNMHRRDESPYWDHFYSVAGIPKSYDPEEKK